MPDITRVLVTRPIADIKPYPDNPRRNDGAVADVAESIRQCGYCAPIIVDEENVILAGHTRLKALKKLGWEEIPVLVLTGLDEAQKRKYRLLDNKTGEIAEWEKDLLKDELEGLDFEGYDFGFEPESELTQYTQKITTPQYEITGECPDIKELLDSRKADDLIADAETADVTEDERALLVAAARRHTVFNYAKIAEYYAHASPAMQREMEKSALVIIDADDAIARGYANFMEVIGAERDSDAE